MHARDAKAWRTDRAHVRHATHACGLADERSIPNPLAIEVVERRPPDRTSVYQFASRRISSLAPRGYEEETLVSRASHVKPRMENF